jgi:hypothetical protein
MQVKTSVKAGALVDFFNSNHSEAQAKGLAVRTGVKAGAQNPNHSETAGLRVKSGVKAGMLAC